MSAITFTVRGVPAPGGSKKVFSIRSQGRHTGRFIVTDDAKYNKQWRALVHFSALAAGCAPMDGPLQLDVVFWMPRPKAHYLPITKKRPQRVLRSDAPSWHTVKPDATKLLRSTEDALTGIAWQDDAQIARQTVTKMYSDAVIGAFITIQQILPKETAPS